MLTTKKKQEVKTVFTFALMALIPVFCMLFFMRTMAANKIAASFNQQTGEVSYETETSLYYGIIITLPSGMVQNEQIGSGIGETMTWSLKNYFIQSGTYTIKVYAVNSGDAPMFIMGTGEILNAVKLSDTITFNYVPSSNTLSTPSDLRWYADGQYFGLKWNTVNGAAKYSVDFYVDGSSQLSYITTSTNWVVYSPQMTTGHQYTATVQAISGDLNSKNSEVSAKCGTLVIDASGKGTVNGKAVTDGENHDEIVVGFVSVDGKMEYHENGVHIKDKTGLVLFNGRWFMVEKGFLDTGYTGFVKYGGGMFYVARGQLQDQKNGLLQDPHSRSDWYFCANGQVALKKSGLVQYDGRWFMVENGHLDTNYTGFTTYGTGMFYVARGQLKDEKSGLLQDPNNRSDWYFLANGQVQKNKTGVVIYNKVGFYVVNGKLDSSYSGMVNYNGRKYNIVNGRVV